MKTLNQPCLATARQPWLMLTVGGNNTNASTAAVAAKGAA